MSKVIEFPMTASKSKRCTVNAVYLLNTGLVLTIALMVCALAATLTTLKNLQSRWRKYIDK